MTNWLGSAPWGWHGRCKGGGHIYENLSLRSHRRRHRCPVQRNAAPLVLTIAAAFAASAGVLAIAGSDYARHTKLAWLQKRERAERLPFAA
jgi:hypothetical protein